jgi:hypothetical protein
MTTETTETTAATETKKADRIVEMFDGSKANFGTRANLLTSIDTDTNEITFKVFTGQILVWKPFEKEHFTPVSVLPEIIRTVVLYGLLNKVKSNIAPVKLTETVEVKNEAGEVVEIKTVDALYEAILSNISTIDEGKFSIRGTGSDEEFELTLDQKAYAMMVINHPELFKNKQGSLDWNEKNLASTEIIADVQATWDAKDRSTKNTIRKNAYFTLEKNKLQMAAIENGDIEVATVD